MNNFWSGTFGALLFVLSIIGALIGLAFLVAIGLALVF